MNASIAPVTPTAKDQSQLQMQTRDAIIFIPGLGSLEPSLTHVMETLCSEFDRAARTSTARFERRPISTQPSNQPGALRTICRIDGNESEPVVDVYGVDYETIQRATAAPTSPLVRAIILASTVLAAAIIWLRAFLTNIWGGKPKSHGQMLQLLACLAVLFLLGAYLIAAVLAVIQLAVTAYASATGSAAFRITLPQGLVIVGAVLGALFPTARDWLSRAAEEYLRVIRYLWVAATRNNLRGEVLTLIENVSERPEIDRIHILGYSFGSLVAIDVMFPASKRPNARMSQVASLSTIGCPFDLVRMLHPTYFDERFAPARADLRWINIYDPIDLLGSNFRNDKKRDDATEGLKITSDSDNEISRDDRQPVGRDAISYAGAAINGGNKAGSSIQSCTTPQLGRPSRKMNIAWNPGQKLGLVSGLLLTSIRVHVQYWGANPRAESALGYLVNELFIDYPANKPALR